MQLTINGGAVSTDSGLKNWGELLEVLEHGEGKDRRVVTAVRFGGVEEPSFRDAHAMARTIGEPTSVEVEACTVGDLIESSAAVVREELATVHDCTIATARAFRGTDLAGANHQLVSLLETYRTLTTLTDSIVAARASAGDPAPDADEASAQVNAAFELLIDAQERNDWMDVADVLEHEVTRALLCLPQLL
jgi:hypothetical protein